MEGGGRERPDNEANRRQQFAPRSAAQWDSIPGAWSIGQKLSLTVQLPRCSESLQCVKIGVGF